MGRVAARLPAVVLAAALLAGCTAASPDAGPDAAPDAGPPSARPSPSASPPPEPQPVPVPLAWTACEEGFECSALPVPLDRDAPSAGTLDLALLRRPATGERIGSLVLNPGGPGASAVAWLRAAWTSLPEPVRARFDLVAVDPRGVGLSGRVRCVTTPEMDALVALDPDPDDAAELVALQDGNRRFAAGCTARSARVLPHVATEQVARDLDLLRASLGDAGLTYLGYSYGTSIGLQFLRLFPDRVRAVVLDSPVDPSLTWDALLGGQARGFDTALAAFLADCEAVRCAFRRAVQGDLLAAYDALAARVEQRPLPGDGARTVGPGELSLGAGAALYSRRTGWPELAEALAAAVRGDGGRMLALSDAYLDRTEEGYAGTSEANLAVNCLDRPWPRQAQPYLDLADEVRAAAPRFGPAIALSGLACAAWPVAPVGDPGPVRAEGAPPVVVLGTTRDPATPHAWAVAVDRQLASSVLLTVDGDGHTVYRASAPACVREAVDAYLVALQVPEEVTCPAVGR
jgi:pimeloyl-ACP methyl ester carboxylesterase